VILWESKNTKSWSPGWIKKLKDDQGRPKQICVFWSRTPCPTASRTSASKTGCGMRIRLRSGAGEHVALPLIELYRVEQSQVGKGQKMEYL